MALGVWVVCVRAQVNPIGGQSRYILSIQFVDTKTQQRACIKLKQDSVDFIGAGAGVSEPGLNRRPDTVIA